MARKGLKKDGARLDDLPARGAAKMCSSNSVPSAGSIRESATLEISSKIFALKDVRQIAGALAEQFARDDPDTSWLRFSVTCEDGSSFESQDLALFADESVINTKRVIQVTMSYSAFRDPKRSINVCLYHGMSVIATNRVEVSGHDTLWVNGIAAKLKRILDSARPQFALVSAVTRTINVAVPIAVGLILLHTLVWLLPDTAPASNENDSLIVTLIGQILTKWPFARYPLKYALAYGVGFVTGGGVLAFFIERRITALWPSIEIQIGPPHTYQEAKRRHTLCLIISTAVIPIFLSLVYDLIRAIAAAR